MTWLLVGFYVLFGVLMIGGLCQQAGKDKQDE
jgi:hypothetical protein